MSTLWLIAHGRVRAGWDNAAKIVQHTGGAVTMADLCGPVAGPSTRHKRKPKPAAKAKAKAKPKSTRATGRAAARTRTRATTTTTTSRRGRKVVAS